MQKYGFIWEHFSLLWDAINRPLTASIGFANGGMPSWIGEGYCLDRLGRSIETIHYSEVALKVDSTDADSLFIKGKALAHLGRFEEALQVLASLTRMDIAHSGAGYLTGNCEYHLCRYKPALAWYKKRQNLIPGS
jgi:tetratricopeptide (TPR) repeat protein